MTNEETRYLRAVKRALCCDRRQKNRLVFELRGRIEDCPQADFDTLCGTFGTPQALAAAPLETGGDAAVTRAFSRKKAVLLTLIAVAAAALLLWGSMVFSLWREGHANLGGTVTEVLLDGGIDALQTEALP